VFWLRSKILITILGHDFVNVITAHFTLTIAREDAQISDVQLGGKGQNDRMRNVRWIGEKGSQEPNGTQLEGEAQACMCMTPGFQQGAVAIVKVKIEGQLFGRWLSHIAAIATALFRSQKLDWHDVLPFHFIRQ
jgi:hypothetical protein